MPALYTSLERETAIAESDYYIAMQPVAPTVRRVIHTIEVSLRSVLDLTDFGVLERLGIDDALLRSHQHSDCQRVGGAAERLGNDGLLVPSARVEGTNLVIYPNHLPLDGVFTSIAHTFC